MKATLKTFWENRKAILEGVKNSIIRDEFVEEIATQRLKLCNSCVRRDDEGSSCVVPGTQPCCNLCGCSLAFKTRSLSSECPKGKWDAIATEEEEDELDNLKD
jgi:hypothetical protein